MFPSSTKREISHFHVVVVQQRHRNVHKSVMHVQSCCFAYPNLYCVIGVLVDVAVVVAYALFLKIPRRRRRQKRSLKSDLAIYETLA